jgi:hypothetical protein
MLYNLPLFTTHQTLPLKILFGPHSLHEFGSGKLDGNLVSRYATALREMVVHTS